MNTAMNTTMRFALCAAVSLAAFALQAETVKWNGTSGNWSNGSIWEGGAAPGKEDIAFFRQNRGTVTIDGDYEVYAVQVQQHPSSENPVTLAGTGSLVATGSTFIVNTSRRLIIDGPAVTAALVKVVKAIDVKSGSLTCSTLESRAAGMTFSATGGKADIGTLNFSTYGGTIAMTNASVKIGTISGTPLWELSGGDLAVTGGGLTIASGVSEAHFDVDSFALGGDLSATDADTKVVFDRAVTVGAYADWSVDSTKISAVSFAESPTFATTDAADGETGRTISVSGMALVSDYDSVAVTGSGTAYLTPAASPFRLNTLSIGAGATLHQKFASIGFVLARRIEMGDGASMTFMPRYVSFETETSSIAPTASVLLDVSSTSSDRHQVWTDFSNGPKPSFSCSGNAAWSVHLAGPFAFVSKNGTVVDFGDKTTCWTGAGGNALWSTAGNWNGEVPSAAGKVAYFYDDNQTIVTNDTARTVARMYFKASAGSFAFFGEPIALNSVVTNEDNSPINLGGPLPVAVYNTISKSSAKATGLSFLSASRGFIALMGEVALTNHIFRFSGDMRVGGNVNCASVIFDTASSSTKPSACTVLPGATVVATAQAFTQDKGIGYEVRPGGVLDVRGGIWDWAHPVTNRIDGTLKLGAAIGTTANTYFSGRGTIQLSGAAATPDTVLYTTRDFGGELVLPDGFRVKSEESGDVVAYTLSRRKGLVVEIK